MLILAYQYRLYIIQVTGFSLLQNTKTTKNKEQFRIHINSVKFKYNKAYI